MVAGAGVPFLADRKLAVRGRAFGRGKQGLFLTVDVNPGRVIRLDYECHVVPVAWWERVGAEMIEPVVEAELFLGGVHEQQEIPVVCGVEREDGVVTAARVDPGFHGQRIAARDRRRDAVGRDIVIAVVEVETAARKVVRCCTGDHELTEAGDIRKCHGVRSAVGTCAGRQLRPPAVAVAVAAMQNQPRRVGVVFGREPFLPTKGDVCGERAPVVGVDQPVLVVQARAGRAQVGSHRQMAHHEDGLVACLVRGEVHGDVGA